jgi:hypothetical protein
MAEVDPDQEAALRRLRAAFGFVRLLHVIAPSGWNRRLPGSRDRSVRSTDPGQPQARIRLAAAALAASRTRSTRL